MEVLQPGIVDAEEGTLHVLSPAVGWWSAMPHAGALLGAGSFVGHLDRLGRRFQLRLPAAAAGRVDGDPPARRVVPVEFGEVLFTLRTVFESLRDADGPRPGVGAPDLPPGTHAVRSPTDGMFYRAAAPGAPAFVVPGDRVRSGQTLGLVEVMKTFHQIIYGGPGLPESAGILEARAEDGREVRAGQVLFVVG